MGHLKLVDFDQVSLSSLNRHASATREDVGISKVQCLRDTIAKIVPNTKVEIVNELFTSEAAERHLTSEDGCRQPDFVVDCIDNIPTKVALIEYCHRRGIRAISTGGAGGKADPTKIRIDDIADTTEDDLCRAIRQQLRAVGIETGPKFCYSTERYSKELVALQAFQKESVDAYRPFEGFRVRVIPVFAAIPAIFGQAISSYVLCELAQQPIDASSREAEAMAKITRKNYRQLYESIKQLAIREGQRKAVVGSLELPFGRTREIYSVIFQGSSAISGKQLGPRALQIVPWRVRGSLAQSFMAPHNLVCMTQAEAKQHLQLFTMDAAQKRIEDVWEHAVIERINRLLRQQDTNASKH